MGVVVRGVARGWPVAVVQFLKSGAWRTGEESAFAVDAAAVEIAQSGAHSLVLTEDGRVLSFGDNESGQGNTGGWKLWP